MSSLSATHTAHRILAEVVGPGDLVVDATVGNGHDTAFLAERVGEEGCVFGVDLQEAAVEATGQRLAEAGLADRCELRVGDHGDLQELVPAAWLGATAAVVFNLGYLPGGDKAIITRTDSTLRALDQALELLGKGGILCVAAYPGHPGGAEEYEAVLAWGRGLARERFEVAHHHALNASEPAPALVVVRAR